METVRVHPTLEGGGFGRRLAFDYGVEAGLVARHVDAPVQVVWSREDDFQHDYYRTPSFHRVQAGLDGDRRVVAWRHHLAADSLLENIFEIPDGNPAVYDVEGASNMPFAIPNIRVEFSRIPINLQMGSWRSVSHSFNVFVVSSFLDEIAQHLEKDPLELQLQMLGEDREASLSLDLPGRRGNPSWDTARLKRVLWKVAEESGWGRALPVGRGMGIACCYFKKTYVAHVAEVSVNSAGVPRVHRVVAIDCGRVVNPDGVDAQVEGGVIDGVASVLKWGITLEEGRVQQSNFDGYPLLRIGEAPKIDIHIIESSLDPSGTGEPPYPSVAPAITNAIYAATGKRVRRLPVRSEDLRG